VLTEFPANLEEFLRKRFPDAKTPMLEVLKGALGLSAPQFVSGNLDLAKAVSLPVLFGVPG
jgi:hypothetical protein